jgi:hypothetical protein
LTYLSYDVEFDRQEDLFDLLRPIEIYQRFVLALGPQAKASNFSKHFDPVHGEIHPNLAIRLKVLDDNQAKKIIEKTAAQIAGEGKLRMFVGPSIWTEEDEVWVKAHEAASECAVRLARQLTKKDAAIPFDQVRKNGGWDLFVVQLLFNILDLSGFKIYLRRQYRRQFKMADQDLAGLANDLASVWWAKGSISDPDGIDSFVHQFLNCTSKSPETSEEHFTKFVQMSEVYSNVFELRRRSSAPEIRARS